MSIGMVESRTWQVVSVSAPAARPTETSRNDRVTTAVQLFTREREMMTCQHDGRP